MSAATCGSGSRLARDDAQRDHAAPRRPRLVAVVVVVLLGAHLRGRLGEVHPQDGRRLALARRHRAELRPAARVQPLDERLERRVHLVGVGHEVGRPEDHRRPEVHRVVEPGAGQHVAVEQRHRDAHRDALRLAQHPAGRRAVPVQPVADAPGDRRRRIGLPVLARPPDVRDDARVEDRVQRRAVVPSALRAAGGRGCGPTVAVPAAPARPRRPRPRPRRRTRCRRSPAHRR